MGIKTSIICVLLALLSLQNNAQPISKIDSLKAQIKSAPDTGKVILLNEISSSYLISNPDSAFEYATAALELSEDINFAKGQALALSNYANFYEKENNTSQAAKCFLDAIAICEDNNLNETALQLYISFGVLAYVQTDYYTALEYFQKTINTAKETDTSLILANSYNNMSAIYMDMDDYRKALRYLKIAYDYLPAQEKYKEGAYYIQGNIFMNYLKLGIIDSVDIYIKKLDAEIHRNDSPHVKSNLFVLK